MFVKIGRLIMDRKIISFLSIIILSSLIAGCGRQKALLYAPTRNPTPLFKNKGDFYTDFSIGFIKSEITAGYALTNFAALYAGAGGGFNNQSNDAIILRPATYTKFRYHQDYYNLGIGYFLNQRLSQNFRFEIFGDLRIGDFSNENEVHWRNPSATTFSARNTSKFYQLSGHYQRIGIMPNFSFQSPNKRTSFTYSLRASKLKFSNLNYNDSTYWEQYSALDKHWSSNLFEHNFTFSISKSEHLKLKLNFVISHYNNANKYAITNSSLMFGIAINTNIFNPDNLPITVGKRKNFKHNEIVN